MGQSNRAPVDRTMGSMESGVRQRAAAGFEIRQHPHPDLSLPSYDVDPTTAHVVELAASLIGTMRVMHVVGLTAPQLGHNVRLLCVDASGPNGLIVLANPEILSVSGRVEMRESCVSVASHTADVVRASHLVLAGIVPGSGRSTVLHSDGLEARCLLHALDHLDGILCVDRVVDPETQLHARNRN
jgi:peptide deformylase